MPWEYCGRVSIRLCRARRWYLSPPSVFGCPTDQILTNDSEGASLVPSKCFMSIR
jgi:hypothetical protein